jgi:hypothetical protein
MNRGTKTGLKVQTASKDENEEEAKISSITGPEDPEGE